MQKTSRTEINRPSGVLRATAGCLLFLSMACSLSLRAASTPPDRMTYQGFMVDNNGVPLATNGPVNYPTVFRIYDEQDGGIPLWSEQQIVTVDNGTFSVVLGEGTAVSGEPRGPLSGVFIGSTASERYLGVTVTSGGNTINLLPRLRLLPAPYAFLASQAAQLIDPSTGVPFVSQSGDRTTIPGNASFGGTTFWGSGSALSTANGGSIELGDSQAASATPYIDFHYGRSAFEDWDVRLINDGADRLSLLGGRLSLGNDLANTKVALWENPADPSTMYGIGVQSGQLRFHLGSSTGRFSFLDGPAGTERMRIQGDGRVGIGTSNPSAMLHVSGGVTSGPREFAFYAKGANNVFGIPTTSTGGSESSANYSIIASQRIGALEFNAFSDVRIKQIVGLSDGRKDLEIIRQLQVKDYHAVDKVGEGESLKKGFIAQEVKALIPEAVTTGKSFVPDIYALPEQFEYDSVRHQLTVSMAKTHDVKEGDRVRFISDDARLELPVLKVLSSQKFIVGDCERKPAQLFVYGKEVSDFLTLNYDRIFTTGISAIQQLHKEIETRDARIASLELELSKVSAQWEARFAALEKMVAASAVDNKENSTKVALRQTR